MRRGLRTVGRIVLVFLAAMEIAWGFGVLRLNRYTAEFLAPYRAGVLQIKEIVRQRVGGDGALLTNHVILVPRKAVFDPAEDPPWRITLDYQLHHRGWLFAGYGAAQTQLHGIRLSRNEARPSGWVATNQEQLKTGWSPLPVLDPYLNEEVHRLILELHKAKGGAEVRIAATLDGRPISAMRLRGNPREGLMIATGQYPVTMLGIEIETAQGRMTQHYDRSPIRAKDLSLALLAFAIMLAGVYFLPRGIWLLPPHWRPAALDWLIPTIALPALIGRFSDRLVLHLAVLASIIALMGAACIQTWLRDAPRAAAGRIGLRRVGVAIATITLVFAGLATLWHGLLFPARLERRPVMLGAPGAQVFDAATATNGPQRRIDPLDYLWLSREPVGDVRIMARVRLQPQTILDWHLRKTDCRQGICRQWDGLALSGLQQWGSGIYRSTGQRFLPETTGPLGPQMPTGVVLDIEIELRGNRLCWRLGEAAGMQCQPTLQREGYLAVTSIQGSAEVIQLKVERLPKEIQLLPQPITPWWFAPWLMLLLVVMAMARYSPLRARREALWGALAAAGWFMLLVVAAILWLHTLWNLHEVLHTGLLIGFIYACGATVGLIVFLPFVPQARIPVRYGAIAFGAIAVLILPEGCGWHDAMRLVDLQTYQRDPSVAGSLFREQALRGLNPTAYNHSLRFRSVTHATAGKTVALMGSSSTYGVGIEPGEGGDYANHLQYDLQNESPGVRVLNSGVKAYTLLKMQAFWRQFTQLTRPDWVILIAGNNDSEMLLAINERKNWERDRSSLQLPGFWYSLMAGKDRNAPPVNPAAEYARTLREFVREMHRDDVETILIPEPVSEPEGWSNPLLPQLWEVMRQVGEEEGCAVLPLFERLQQRPYRDVPYLYMDYVHPSPAGNAWVASAIAEQMKVLNAFALNQ